MGRRDTDSFMQVTQLQREPCLYVLNKFGLCGWIGQRVDIPQPIHMKSYVLCFIQLVTYGPED